MLSQAFFSVGVLLDLEGVVHALSCQVEVLEQLILFDPVHPVSIVFFSPVGSIDQSIAYIVPSF